MTDFLARHVGPNHQETTEMLDKIGVSTLSELIDKTIPSDIRLQNELNIAPAISESEYLKHISDIGQQNQVFKSFIGLGYHETITPSVILRNVLENPGWYTAYTPYQAEISQGRLEALLNFQTMVLDLTGMDVANASLLDEATAAAEAMLMFFNARSRSDINEGKNKFLVSKDCFPQTIDVVEGRAKNLGIEITIADANHFESDGTYFGAILQYPTSSGQVMDLTDMIEKMHQHGMQVAVGADILSLVLLTAPGKMGADVVYGNSQRFGVPMGYGGPHAAFFATLDKYKRNLPGRIIGVSKDSDGHMALRMALQTREQHIKRDKATSNICTAQALLAVMASMYAVYHGPVGLQRIAHHVHNLAKKTAEGLLEKGHTLLHYEFFDTLAITHVDAQAINQKAQDARMNLYAMDANTLCLSFAENHTEQDVENLLSLFDNRSEGNKVDALGISDRLTRKDAILSHSIFNTHHSESKMMRYLKRLENKDLSLVHSMIALGSCTMKLNAASELIPISNPNFANIHPFAPLSQTKGYTLFMDTLAKDLCECTGFAGVSLQPNSGAQGEYAGLMVIKAYHESNGDFQRKK